MNKHKPHQRLLARGLALVMALGTMPVSASAYAAAEAGGEISSFEALSEETTNRGVALGTSLDDLNLPKTLRVSFVDVDLQTGEEQQIEQLTVSAAGNFVETLPSLPQKENHTFTGWVFSPDVAASQNTSEAEQQANFFTTQTPVNEDITVYAFWVETPSLGASRASELPGLQIMPAGMGTASPITASVQHDGKFSITIPFKINAASGANGAGITVVLQSNPYYEGMSFSEVDNYYQAPEDIDVQMPHYCSFDSSTTLGNKVSVQLRMTGGAQNAQFDVTITYRINPMAAYWAKTGQAIANIEAKAQLDGQYSTRTWDVKAGNVDTGISWTSCTKSPAGNTTPDFDNVFAATARVSIERGRRFMPNTEVKFILYYPSAATPDTSSMNPDVLPYVTVDDSDPDTHKMIITYTASGVGKLDPYFANQEGNDYLHVFKGFKLNFPSLNYAVTTAISTVWEVSATFVDGSASGEAVTIRNFSPTNEAISGKNPYDFLVSYTAQVELSLAPPVQVSYPNHSAIRISPNTFDNSNNQYPFVLSNIANANVVAIPDFKIVWYNDINNTGKKAYPAELEIFREDAVAYPILVKVYVADASSGTPSVGEITASENTGTATFTLHTYLTTPGKYIEKIEIIPQRPGPVTGLPIPELPSMAQMKVNFRFFSPVDGKYPDGTAVQHDDRVPFAVGVEWKGETNTAQHAQVYGSKYSYDSATQISKLMFDEGITTTVVYANNYPLPVAYYSNTFSGNRTPGSSFYTDITLYNRNRFSVRSAIWQQGEIIIVPPAAFKLDTSQVLYLQNAANNSIGGQIGITETEVYGKTVYKLTLPEHEFPPVNGDSSADHYTIKHVAFHVASGAESGTYYLGQMGNDNSTVGGTTGKIFATSGVLGYRTVGIEDESNNIYNDNAYNFDLHANNLYMREFSDTPSIQVKSSSGLNVSAQLYNGTTWVDSNQPDAAASVPLDGEGKFRLIFQNTGTTYIGNIRMLDILPHIGDYGAIDPPSARDSAWDSTLLSFNIKVYDGLNFATASDVSELYPGLLESKLQYSTQKSPSYSGGDIVRSGADGPFVGSSDIDGAQSLLYVAQDSNAQGRLAPGHMLVFEGSLKAPETADADDVGLRAYNSFSFSAAFFLSATFTTPADRPAFEPIKQAFVIKAIPPVVIDPIPDGGGGGGTTTTTAPEKAPNQPVTAAAPVTATAGENGSASASIPEKSMTDAIAKAQAEAKAQGKTANGISVALNVTMPKGATALTVTLPRKALESLVSAEVTSLELNGSPVKVTLDKKALAEIKKQSSGNISITITPNAKLSTLATTMIGTRPVYDLTVSYTKDGKNATISSFGGGTATVSVPYTPAKGEAVGGLYAVYVDEKGNATRIAGSAYDANSGCVMFTTTHFSLYGIGYTAPSAKFTDMNTHWAKEFIDYVVGRGLLSGTTESTFAPNTAMTRGMLVTALGRLANVDTKAYTTNSFKDVKTGSVFGPYIEWAYKKGIVQGIDNSQFAPGRAITREEIAVIFVNFAKAAGYTLPVTRTATTYADASGIGSAYKTAVTAMQQAGIMMGGTGGKFNPKSSATRAEVSAMLCRYIKLTIDPATAQGWAKNDAGQYLYYKDGKALTGTQTIEGVKYFFNTDGTLKTGWIKDGDSWWFYDRNTMLKGFWDLDAGGGNKTYYFTKDGSMVAGKWLEIDGKWYYFNADGSLARSTKIDGYEVDANGVRKTK